MGLGPPICLDCQILYAFDNDTKEWYCLKCGNTETDKCLWDVDNHEQIVENTKKYTEENK